MMPTESLVRVHASLKRRGYRRAKSLWQRWNLKRQPTGLAFIFGCQRSGTTMFVDLLDSCPEIMAYGEKDPPAMGRDLRIRDEQSIRRLLTRSPAHLIALKPICDSQWADRLLATHRESRALWIYRHYDDVINSSLRRFSGQLQRMQQLVEGGWEQLGWRMERFTAEDPDIQLMHRCYDQATREDAAALMWLARSRLFLKYGLNEHPRARLIRYERLVEAPQSVGRECFEFLGIPFREEYVSMIHGGSVKKHAAPKVLPIVRDACQSLQRELDRAHDQQLKVSD